MLAYARLFYSYYGNFFVFRFFLTDENYINDPKLVQFKVLPEARFHLDLDNLIAQEITTAFKYSDSLAYSHCSCSNCCLIFIKIEVGTCK